MSPLRHSGNDDLLTAAWVSADALARGLPLHVHAEGPRGTGKTTGLRAFARRLPTIARVAGCPYNCDPKHPHCPLHRDLPPSGLAAAGVEDIPTPFLEISASAKLATAVGTIDLPRLLDPRRPEAALLPGTLARAHRGIVFVDEINRLADVAPELADALLDVMGTKPGRLQIEEAGLPTVVLPAVVAVWAASNPDEDPGPLEQTRLQLADRFDLRIRVEPPRDVALVLAILRGEAGSGDPEEPPLGGGQGDPAWPSPLLHFMANFYVRAGLGSLRALQAWQHAAAGLARHGGRGRVAAADVRRAARLTLAGRIEPGAVDSGLRGVEAVDESGAVGDVAGAPRPIAAVSPMVAPEWTGRAEAAE